MVVGRRSGSGPSCPTGNEGGRRIRRGAWTDRLRAGSPRRSKRPVHARRRIRVCAFADRRNRPIVLSPRKTAVAAAGAALATVPVAAATAQDNDTTAAPTPDTPYTPAPPVAAPARPRAAVPDGPEAAAIADRARANVVRDGALNQRGERAHRKLVAKNVEL